MKESLFRRLLLAANRFVIFFLLVAFVITCCMMLFISVLQKQLGVILSEENISIAAKLTFGNVVLLAFLISTIDLVRRKLTVDRPAKKITDAAEKIMQGDFTVRIPTPKRQKADDKFTEIALCVNRLAEELSGIETLRTDFIANVSHEIKTPLAVMGNYAAMLGAKGITEEEREEYAAAIKSAVRKLSDLITNILKLNKLENQQIFPKAESYDLGEQLCECLLSFEAAWEKKEIAIETDLAEDVTVSTDRDMLSLVFNNLISNAIKFTEKGGTVSLRLVATEDRATVEVADTGCGISPEVGAHIFDRFYQGDTSHASEGNGLGLALVKRIVDITGSEITVRSEVGKGTVFAVTLKRSL